MNKILSSIFVSMFLLGLFSAALAQETQTININDDIMVSYTEVLEFDQNEDGNIDKWTYKNKDSVVLTAYDTDGDKKSDLWLKYDNNQILSLEIHDTDKDGEPDVFFEMSSNETIKKAFGDGLKKFERPETKIFTPEQKTLSDEELLGDLSDLDSKSGNSIFILLILIILSGGVWWYFKNKRK